jgi:hypothetical protein
MLMDDGTWTEADRRAMDFLRGARPLRGLAPGAVARIERNVETARAGRRRPRPLRFAMAAAVIALVAGGTFALAHVGWRNVPVVGRLFARPVPPSAPPSCPDIPALEVGHRQVGPQEAQNSTGGAAIAGAAVDATAVSVHDPKAKWPTYTEPKRDAKAVRRTIAVRSLVESSPQQVAPAITEDPALAESQSFAAAIERWHKHRDSDGALGALDAHERRFPSGSLIVEARVLRAEILLSLGREQESLRLLDRVRLEGSPRARELFTVRGELRVKAGRCAEARADLDAVLREGANDGLSMRATQALGHCR